MQPKVSIITFVYVDDFNNRLPLLKECLKSVEVQNYENYEHIVIDDGSSVDIKNIVLTFPNTVYYKKVGSGILSSTYTFNIGHTIAKGDYCIYLPSDDLHFKDAISGLSKALTDEPKASMAIGNAIYNYSDVQSVLWKPQPKLIERKLGEGNHINGCAVMWRRSAQLLELLPPNFVGFCSDYDLFSTITKLGSIAYTDTNVVEYRQVSDSTRNKTKTKSGFIGSPRKEDALFYQYSKLARVNFVKCRLSMSLDEMLYNRYHDNKSLLELEVDQDFDLLKVKQLFIQRKWDELHQKLKVFSQSYVETCDQLDLCLEKRGSVVTIKSISVGSVILMQKFRNDFRYIVKYGDIESNWVFDYCPIPRFLKIVHQDEKTNHRMMNYLGIS